MSDIFISYSKQDRDRARDIAARLKQEGWTVFWDRTIPVGKTWDEILEKELETTRVIIVLWSNDSVRSEWVRAEAAEAVNRKILAPASLESVTIPIRFRFLQTADISGWKFGGPDTEGMQLLIEAVVSIGNLKIAEKKDEAKKAPYETGTKWKFDDEKPGREAVAKNVPPVSGTKWNTRDEKPGMEAVAKKIVKKKSELEKVLEKSQIVEVAPGELDKEAHGKSDIKIPGKVSTEKEFIKTDHKTEEELNAIEVKIYNTPFSWTRLFFLFIGAFLYGFTFYLHNRGLLAGLIKIGLAVVSLLLALNLRRSYVPLLLSKILLIFEIEVLALWIAYILGQVVGFSRTGTITISDVWFYNYYATLSFWLGSSFVGGFVLFIGKYKKLRNNINEPMR